MLLGGFLTLGLVGKAQSFSILTTGETSTSYSLDDIEKVVFTNDNFKVYTTSRDEDSYSIYVIEKMMFGGTATSVDEATSENPIKLYPNPVSDVLTIEYDANVAYATITDMMGVVIKNISLNPAKTTIDVSSLQPGVYLLSLEKQVVKFIKQ